MARRTRMAPRLSAAGISSLKACLLALLLVTAPAWATFQQAEQLQLDGKHIDLLMFPLAPWLDAHPDALPNPGMISTGNWRRYRGYWEIRDGKLWLVRLTQDVAGPPRKVVMTGLEQMPDGTFATAKQPSEWELSWPEEDDIADDLFDQEPPVLATWFSGTLVAVLDESAGVIHYGPDPRRYVVLWVDRGQVGRRVELGEDQFRDFLCDRFAAYRRTPAYARDVAEAPKGNSADLERSLFWLRREDYLALDLASSKPHDEVTCRKLND
jgi:hypothetical protein